MVLGGWREWRPSIACEKMKRGVWGDVAARGQKKSMLKGGLVAEAKSEADGRERLVAEKS